MVWGSGSFWGLQTAIPLQLKRSTRRFTPPNGLYRNGNALAHRPLVQSSSYHRPPALRCLGWGCGSPTSLHLLSDSARFGRGSSAFIAFASSFHAGSIDLHFVAFQRFDDSFLSLTGPVIVTIFTGRTRTQQFTNKISSKSIKNGWYRVQSCRTNSTNRRRISR